MARPIVYNTQRTTDYQNAMSVLHNQRQVMHPPAVATNHDQSNQLQYQLARGIVQPVDVNASKGFN